MSTVLANAGWVGFLVAAGVLFGLLVTALCAFMALRKMRVPLSLLVALPYLVLMLGAMGGFTALLGVAADVNMAEPSKIPLVAMSGAWHAMAVDVLSRWGAALVLIAGAWAAAAGSLLAPGSEPRFTPLAAVLAGATTVIGSLAIIIFGALHDVGGEAVGLASFLCVGGLGVAVSAARRAADDDMNRVASLRFASSMCLFFGVFHASRAIDIGHRIDAFSATGPIMTATELSKAIEAYAQIVDPAVTLGVVGVILALVIALFGFFAEIGEVVDRFTMFDAFGVVGLVLVVAGLRYVEISQFDAVVRVATNEPAVEMYRELRPELPVAAISQGEVSTAVRLVEGGFGDVLVYEKEEWFRVYRWNGRTWIVQDPEPLAEAKLDARPPLLAVSRDTPSEKLVEMLAQTPSKMAYLVMRASEVKPGTWVPPELGRLQVTFLPLALAEGRDLKTQPWIEAGSNKANWGPTSWFGEHDDSIDSVEYANAVLTSTGATGVQIIAPKRKVGDIAATCLPFVLREEPVEVAPVDPATVTPPAPPAPPAPGTPPAMAPGSLGALTAGPPPNLIYEPTRWCAVSVDEYEVARAEAAALWEYPRPTNVRLDTVVVEGLLDQVEVDDRVRRELGGIGWCAEKAVEGGERLRGSMTLTMAVTKDGQVYDTRVDPESKLQSPTILRCAAQRFRKLQFTILPMPPEPPPPPPGKRAPPYTPPPPPKASVHLDF